MAPTKAEVCRKYGISEQTYYRWRQLYGGLEPRFGAWATVASRFYRWRKAKIWQRTTGRV
jgi:hypothetical protein